MAGTRKRTIGSRAEVMHGVCEKTRGGLKKKDLFMKKGRIVSRKASAAGKKALKFLTRQGYIAKKGKFMLMRKSMAHSPKSKKSRGRRTRRRGGADVAPTVGDAASDLMGAVSSSIAGKKY